MCCKTTKYVLSVFVACIALALIALPAFAQGAKAGRSLPHPQLLGPENLSKQITVNVWLKQHNKAAFDELVRQMYDKNSPTYHHWLTPNEYKLKFAPTDAEAATVRQHLANNNLSVVSTDKFNHVVTARGTVADVQRAFGVQLNRVTVNGAVHRMPAAEPAIAGPAAPLVATVQGLADLSYHNYFQRRIDPDTGKPEPMVPVKSAAAAPTSSVVKFFNANCYGARQTKFFTTPGGGPHAVYSGARYGNNINAGPPNLPPCGYDAPQIQVAYGLKALYSQKIGKQRLDGTGQTVVIVDAFGNDNILNDSNIFSQINALPPLTSGNFQIFYPTGPASCGGVCGSWADETSLDVQWAHAVAPGANIALVLGVDNSFTALDLANLFAIENLIGPVISNSFGIPEIVLAQYLPSELVVENSLTQLAAALGISLDVSTGDAGDNLILDNVNFGIDSVSPGANADSPYATAIGGTSLFLNSDRSIKFQTGWGNNLTRIADVTPNPPVIPPLQLGFQGGAGGGESQVYVKPPYQGGLPGVGRQTPDISYVADPFTGVEYIITDPAQGPLIGVVGGTSLSCPMFSALWAITTQAAGTWLGQAAPLLYSLPPDAINDVLAVTSPDNVTGTVYIPKNPPYTESADSLAAPLDGTTDYISALYNSPFSTRWFVITFGTNSSLTTGPGWDNTTGLGTPNGAAFVADVVGSLP
ncbi:MAG: S53 family peptidase [Acidobacteriia bacterium]|nr:S53 family peptidase [Terriglobia bacterium]